MQYLKARQQKIITFLVRENQRVKGKILADELGISLRSLQSEIADINRSFPEKLIHSSNQGYYLNQDLWNREAIAFEEASSNDLLPILKKLMMEDHQWQIDEFAEACYLSTSAMIHKLKAAQAELDKHHLKIVRKKNHIRVAGNEYDKRQYIHSLILEEVEPVFMSLENCAPYFAEMDVMYIKTIITAAIQKYNCHIEESYAANVYLNITISLSRMRRDYHMEHVDMANIPTEAIEYQIARDICEQYARHYTIAIYPDDIAYITTLILGQVKPLMQGKDCLDTHRIDETFRREISDILMKTFNYYMLNIDYEPFLYNFVLHVDALITRSKHKQFVSNAIAENIKSSCPFIYDVAVYLAKEIEERYQITISDEEIGFISVHIGFVIENSTKEHHLIKVLLVCDDYHQTAAHILHKLKENYEHVIEITNVISGFQALPFETSADLIITTVPVGFVHHKMVTISPFYTMMDQLAVDDAVHECRKAMKARQEQQLLLTYFHEKLFFKRTDLSDKEDVIRFLGRQIENFGLAKPGFTESVLKREQMSSTCFFETFAIPHALELNAKQTMFCVLINEKGIQWNQHRIKIVLMIAVQQKDRKSFMKIYNSVIHVLWNKEKLSRLIESESFPAFLEILKLDMR